MKPYLLIAGHNYYPGAGTEDWKGCYGTRKEVEELIEQVPICRVITKGKSKGNKELVSIRYKFKDIEYDWYQIIDLREWEMPRE